MMQVQTLTTICVVFQVSHALHLSAVSPSYYRFHVEHLQSDDYSKDKVKHESFLSFTFSSNSDCNRIRLIELFFFFFRMRQH